MFPPHRCLWAWLLALVASLISPSLLRAQPSFATNGLVAFYPFNGNANDASGNGRHGAIFGATLTTDRFGRPGRALHFNGVDNYMVVSASALNISNTITLTGFLNYEDNNPQHAGINGILERGIASNAGGYALRLEYGGVMSTTLSNPYQQYVATQRPLDSNRWYHFAITYDGAAIRTYIDGLLVANTLAGPTRLPGSAVLNGYLLNIGRESVHYFWGELDDLRFYNRALSDSEVGALYAYEKYLEPTWDSAGSLRIGRQQHASVLLNDGRVLVAGGQAVTGHVASAELYYPSTNGWVTTAAMSARRREHTLTLLDNGKVLVAGGLNPTGMVTECELYDPETGQWSMTGSLFSGRYSHTATKLLNGKVLVASGCFGGSQVNTAEIYDPATGKWTNAAALPEARCNHAATLLSDGRVLVSGGYAGFANYATTALYDPSRNVWTPGPLMSSARYMHSSTLLLDGKVLVAGGSSEVNRGNPRSTAEVYDPVANSWSMVGSMSTNRYFHAATLLPNGDVLVSGGATVGGWWIGTAELFSPQSGRWSPTAGLSYPRVLLTTTLLQNGRVLAVGGYAGGTFYQEAESYVIPPPRRATAVAEFTNGVVSLVRVLDGGYGYSDPPVVLILGGGGSGATAVATVVNGVVTAITVTNPGSGYTSTPTVSVASPPFSPELAVEISRVRVRLKVVLGRRYILQSSFNLSSWNQVGDAFTAQAEELVQDFDVNATGRYFRVQQVP